MKIINYKFFQIESDFSVSHSHLVSCVSPKTDQMLQCGFGMSPKAHMLKACSSPGMEGFRGLGGIPGKETCGTPSLFLL
jgi:hypothetical protein